MQVNINSDYQVNINSDYFVCRRFHCLLLKDRCIERQGAKTYIPSTRAENYKFPECLECEQGINITEELLWPLAPDRTVSTDHVSHSSIND